MKRFLCGLIMVAACTLATGCDHDDPAAKSVMDAARVIATQPPGDYGTRTSKPFGAFVDFDDLSRQ